MRNLLSNYLKVSFRTLFKVKLFAFLNIFGLAVGMATCLLLAQYVYFEYSYDHFHENAEYIYRIPISLTGKKELAGTFATNHPPVGPTMKDDFPEVEDFCRMVHPTLFFGHIAIKYINESGTVKSFREENIYFADSSIFKMFTFPLANGDPSTALSEPNSIALSETAAKKYFGNEHPIGKTLYFLGVKPLQVSAVFADIPKNSHIQFDILISYNTLWWQTPHSSWKWPGFYNFIQLKPGTNPKEFEAKFPSFADKYLGAIAKEFGFQPQFLLQPLTKIHLHSSFKNEPQPQGSERKVRFLSLLAIFVLTIAWINYINLTMARSFARAREVGLRKVIGSRKSSLIAQFLIDSLLVNILAAFLSIVITALALPYFSKLSGGNMSGNIFESVLLQNSHFWWIAIVLLILGALLSGLYPALKLASLQPAQVIKGNFFGSPMGIRFRKALVLFQFTISLVLIAGTLLVRQQNRYMMNEDLGFNKDQMLIVKYPAIYDSTTMNRTMYLKSELQRLPEVISLANTSDIPGHDILMANTFRTINQRVENEDLTKLLAIDSDFLETLNIPLLAGRYFNFIDSSRIFNSKSNLVILNRKATEMLGFNEPGKAINQNVYFRFRGRSPKAKIIGVVENYHQRSLREAIDPILYYYPSWSNWSYFCIHVRSQNLTETISAVRNRYKDALPNNPFDYFFLDEYFNRQYQTDQQFVRMFGAFAFLAILVACLGLYGLLLFMTSQRKKEIAIRKVFGSSAMKVLKLLFKDFYILILISLVITGPIIYWLGKKWLNNFSYRIEVNWLIFVVPVLILLFISLITTVVQTLKAALENPVNVLRHE